MTTSKKTIQTGNVGKDIWIGRFLPYYDFTKTHSDRLGPTLHILRFSTAEAKIAIEMLQGEIKRLELEKEAEIHDRTKAGT